MMSFKEKAKIAENQGPQSTLRPNLNRTMFSRLQRVFSKISPAQLEMAFVVIVFTVGGLCVLRNDMMLPGYSKVVQGEMESYGGDAVDTYRMEPILDENGKLKAMRKIRIKKAEAE